jgi:chromosome segregation ATPase
MFGSIPNDPAGWFEKPIVLRERHKLGMSETIAPARLPECLEDALRTLTAALDRLDAACERRAKADSLRANLEEELAVMQDDRLKLAVELDAADARARALETANDEVKRRLVHVGAEIRAVLTELADGEG